MIIQDKKVSVNLYLTKSNINFIKLNGKSKELDELLTFMSKNNLTPKLVLEHLFKNKETLFLINNIIDLGQKIGIIKK